MHRGGFAHPTTSRRTESIAAMQPPPRRPASSSQPPAPATKSPISPPSVNGIPRSIALVEGCCDFQPLDVASADIYDKQASEQATTCNIDRRVRSSSAVWRCSHSASASRRRWHRQNDYTKSISYIILNVPIYCLNARPGTICHRECSVSVEASQAGHGRAVNSENKQRRARVVCMECL